MNGDLKLRLTLLKALTHLEYDFFWFIVDELAIEALLPLRSPASVDVYIEEIENGEDDTAYTLGDGTTFQVYLDERMPTGMLIDYVIHELAHVHSWEVADDNEDHCDEFGKSYAHLYRKYLELYDHFWSSHP